MEPVKQTSSDTERELNWPSGCVPSSVLEREALVLLGSDSIAFFLMSAGSYRQQVFPWARWM